MRWIQNHWTPVRLRQLTLEMLVALSLAFLIWLYTHSRALTTLEHIQVPVQIQLVTAQRELFSLEVNGEARVTASFSGSSSRMREFKRKLQRGQVQASVVLTLSEDKLNETTCGETVRVEPAHFSLPPGVHVDLADTATIQITLHRMTERLLPVRLDFTSEGKVSQIKVEPSTVLVRGPQAVLDKALAISTQPCSLNVPPDETADPMLRGKVELVSEIDGRPVFTHPKQVNYRCKVQPKHRVYEVADIPVFFLTPPQFPYRPRFANDKAGKINVRLIGPVSDEKPPVLAFVELTGTNLARGRNLEPVRLQLPKDFTLLHNNTPVITFFLDEGDRPVSIRPDTPMSVQKE